MPIAVNWTDKPRGKLVSVVCTAMLCSTAEVTVTAVVPVTEFMVAVTLVVPLAFAVASPVVLTVAVAGVEEAH